MGIARFYRWLSERYPLVNEVIEVDNVPEFDNFYLDMNGIIHNCSHGNTGGQKNASEEHMWLDVFKYISGLVYRIKPKKLIYLAVDGVAPRAKMNQQRSRRFRAAHDAKELREKNDRMNHSNGVDEDPAKSKGFDSNCITPGTEFMERLVFHLEFFVKKKIAEDPLWKDIKVVLSGPDVPGEGEHKIMDYIRSVKSQPGHDPNTRHCLYGLDADLIMLSLASHEPYFALLREEIDFSFSKTKSKESRSMIKPDKFQLLHIRMLREYLALDFLGDDFVQYASVGTCERLERTIDDFVMFCFLVGNDFLPHLPFSEIGEGGLNKLFACYKDLMNKQGAEGHYLTRTDGSIDYFNLYHFLEAYMAIEFGMVDEIVSHRKWEIGQTRVCNSKQTSNPAAAAAATASASALNEPGWIPVAPPVSSRVRKQRLPTPHSVEEAMDQYYDVKLGIVNAPDAASSTPNPATVALVTSYLEGLQWVYWYYYKGPPSWDWYYPYHYSPFAVDVVEVLEQVFGKGKKFSAKFDLGKPFLPFQQLMAVLPPASGKWLVPAPLYQLMVSASSPIREFYPEEFLIDIDGVRVPWGGVTIIPFVDEKKLVAVTKQTSEAGGLTKAEMKRNSLGVAKIYSSAAHNCEVGGEVVTSAVSTIPSLVKDVATCAIRVVDFDHPPLPRGMEIFPHTVLPGYSPRAHLDFATLFTGDFQVSSSFGTGVRIFNSASKQESLFVTLLVDVDKRNAELQRFVAGKVWNDREMRMAVNFPFYSQQHSLVAVYDGEVKHKVKAGKFVAEPVDVRKCEADIDWLTSKMAEMGVVVEFTCEDAGKSERDLFYEQPLVEVSSDGGTAAGNTFKALACLAKVVKRRVPKNPERVAGPEVKADVASWDVCLNVRDGRLFGLPFNVQGVNAVFASVPCSAWNACMQLAMIEVVKISQSVKYMHWLSVPQIAASLGVSSDFVWAIFGEVWLRFGRNQEEIGMNLWSLSSTGEPQCVANLSKFTPAANRKTFKNTGKLLFNRWDTPNRNEWTFSSIAMDALREYMHDWPELVADLSEAVAGSTQSAINGGITLPGKRFFGRFKRPLETSAEKSSKDDWVSEYYLGKLVSYVNGRPWKNLSISHWQYESMQSRFTNVIAKFVDQFATEKAVSVESVSVDSAKAMTEATLFSSLKNGPALALGQRGVYVKPNGVVPVGTWGTIIGIYGDSATSSDARIDVLLDAESLNASSLNGVCADLRGIRILRSDWRAPVAAAVAASDQGALASVKNKILADLIVALDSAVLAPTKAPTRVPRVVAVVPPSAPAPVKGIKLNVQDLFGKKSTPAATAPVVTRDPSAMTKPRPLPPVARISLPPELLVQESTSASSEVKLPDFLLSKLRPATPK